MIRAELSGEIAPEPAVRHTELQLSATTYAVYYHGEAVDRGSVEVTAAPGPVMLVLRGDSGPNAGRTIRCIFQRVGDRLRVCYGLDGNVPADFTTRSGDARYLATYRRRT